MKTIFNRLLLLLATSLVVVAGPPTEKPTVNTNKTELATFGGGCFWCLEAFFEKVPGVKNVVSGYAAGHTANPTYPEVSGGDSGHAEVVQIEFDPALIPFEKLLDVFWACHDPTTANRQGADVGTQYRSIILFHSPEQHAAALRSKELANAQKFAGKIATDIEPLKKFFVAEDYHQDYFRKHPDQPYCARVIAPKLLKLEHKGVIPK